MGEGEGEGEGRERGRGRGRGGGKKGGGGGRWWVAGLKKCPRKLFPTLLCLYILAKMWGRELSEYYGCNMNFYEENAKYGCYNVTQNMDVTMSGL